MPRTYVITGAGSGIGKRTLELLTSQGERVIGVDLKNAEVLGDLSSRRGCEQAARDAIDHAGGTVDAVIACAGLGTSSVMTAKVNYFGAVNFLECVRPGLLESAAPRAAVISSMASMWPVSSYLVEAMLAGDEEKVVELATEIAQDPEQGAVIYGSSKRAVSRWIRRAAPTVEWAGAGIPLNAVGPGIVATPMTEGTLSTDEGTRRFDAMVPMPLNYHQSPDSVAQLLAWLTSEHNTHCCGQTIYCDGGADVELRGEDVWAWNNEAIKARFARL